VNSSPLTRIFFILLTLLSATLGIGQTNPSTGKDLELSAQNIKRLFSLKPDMCCPVPPTEWTACYATDSTYATSDTVILYSDMYYYLTAHCCYVTSWTFSNSTTFSLTETHVCEEPPPTLWSFGNSGLNIKFKEKEGHLIMSVYHKQQLNDQFMLLSLDHVEMKNGEQGYKLTMLRIQ